MEQKAIIKKLSKHSPSSLCGIHCFIVALSRTHYQTVLSQLSPLWILTHHITDNNFNITWIVAGFSPRMPGFDPRAFIMQFCSGDMALGQVPFRESNHLVITPPMHQIRVR